MSERAKRNGDKCCNATVQVNTVKDFAQKEFFHPYYSGHYTGRTRIPGFKNLVMTLSLPIENNLALL